MEKKEGAKLAFWEIVSDALLSLTEAAFGAAAKSLRGIAKFFD